MLSFVLSLTLALAPASYIALRLDQMFLGADRIVAGTIVELDDTTYRLRVEADLLGNCTEPDVRVRRFVNWTCAHRWKEYELGERLVLFATNGTGENALRLRVMSAGGEGEMPLLGNSATVMSLRGPGFTLVPHPRNRNASCASVPLDDLKEAIAAFRRCFVRDGSNLYETAILASGVDELDIEELAARSPLLRHTFRHMFAYGPKPMLPAPKAVRDIAAISLADPALPFRARPSAWMRSQWSGVDRFGGVALAFCGDAHRTDADEIAVGTSGGDGTSSLVDFEGIVSARRDGTVEVAHDLHPRTSIPRTTTRDAGGIPPSLANLGDLDGDGLDEIAIGGRIWADTPSTVRIVFLDRDRNVRESVDLGAQSIVREASKEIEGDLGRAVARVGDLDGDGTVEIAVTCARGILSSAKERRVLLLSVDAKARVQAVRPIFCPKPPGEIARFGEDVCGLGDVDGNGIPDLAISDPNVVGSVYILMLARDAGVLSMTRVTDATSGFDGFLLGEAQFGSCLAPLGDLDKDGVVDLLVGSERHLWCLFLKRDGSVKSHRAIREVDGPFDIGRSAATRIDPANPSLVQVAASGERRTAEGKYEPVVWRFTLDNEGKIVAE